MSEEEIKVGVISIDLMEFRFNNKSIDINGFKEIDEQDRERKIDISYDIKENHEVSFKVIFTFREPDFEISGAYLMDIKIENAEDIEVLVEEEKQKLVLPVYTKISSLITSYSEQIRPFPIIYNPKNWIKNK